MARNGSGTYSVVNTFVSGTTITASGHNQNWSDAASEITNSVAADGQTTMTGPLKASNGTVAAPAVTFASDADSGMYRIGSNNIGVAVGGAKVLDVSSTGLDVTGVVKQAGFELQPVGIVSDYAGSTAPSGWLLCYGQAISRTTYALLFAVVSTTYGSGDGSTTFNVPDLRGRATAGKDDMGGSAASRITSGGAGFSGTALGAAGGAQTYTLATSEIPAHNHDVTDPGHNHTFTTHTGLTNVTVGAGVTAETGEGSGSTGSNTTGISIQNTGGGGAHLNVQPTMVLNKIIFTGVA